MTTDAQERRDLASEAEDWLRAELPLSWIEAIDRDDSASLAQARKTVDVEEWWRRLGKVGYFVPTWPKEYGGHDAKVEEARAVRQVLARYKIPRPLSHASFHAASAILKWGTAFQKERFLPAISEQTEIWCQLLSEPGAGSDLSSLSTRAIADERGRNWTVTGQKVWTSFAQFASWGIIACRTDPDVGKRDGISVFILDMHGEGVDVRPLRQINGDSEFNEVFIDQATVPAENLLGQIGGGWRIIRDLLGGERQSNSGMGGAAHPTVFGRSLDSIISRYAPVANPVLRDRLARAYIDERVLQLTNQRMADVRGKNPEFGSIAAVTKIFRDEHTKRLHELAVDLGGSRAVAWSEGDEWNDKSSWSFLRSRSASIGGGTTQMMRNIVGERVLGLPKEPDPFRAKSWKETPR